MKRPLRTRSDGPTEAEWLWLTAAPGHNPFLGYPGGQLTSQARLRELWRAHEAEIRATWGNSEPAGLPHGHPAGDAAE